MEVEIAPSRVVKDLHNILNDVLGHLKWYFGPKRRGPAGSYHKDIVAGDRLPIMKRAVELKASGKNSLEVADLLGIPIKNVNGFWNKI